MLLACAPHAHDFLCMRPIHVCNYHVRAPCMWPVLDARAPGVCGLWVCPMHNPGVCLMHNPCIRPMWGLMHSPCVHETYAHPPKCCNPLPIRCHKPVTTLSLSSERAPPWLQGAHPSKGAGANTSHNANAPSMWKNLL